MAKSRIRITESASSLNKKLSKELAQQINSRLRKNKSRIENKLRGLIPAWIRSSPEIASLNDEGIQGSLNAQFGLYPGQAGSATDAIVSAVVSTVEVRIRSVSRNLNTSALVEFVVQPLSYDNLLFIPEGTVIQTTNGKPLPWLEWLLTLGNTIVVAGYQYTPEDLGRSGGGTMNPGTGWRVPPQYSGTIEDNFITRALANRETQIQPILQEIFNG